MLYDQHLITEPAVGRYRLHDLLRQHARTLAAGDSPQDQEAATGRLLDYYVQTAAMATKHIPIWTTATKPPTAPGRPPVHQPTVTSHGQAIGWMEAERANLYAALSYAAETARHPHVIALSAAMAGFLEATGPWDKAIALHEAAAAVAAQDGDKAGQAGALNHLSSIQAMTGDAQAVANGERVLDLYRELGDLGGLADTMSGQATLVTSLGEYQRASDLAREALRLYTQIGHRRGQADANSALAVLQAAAGDYRAALAGHRQALQMLTELGDRWGQMQREIDIGILLRLTGEHAAAELTQRRALRTVP